VSLQTAHESGIPPARERFSRPGDASAALDQLEQVLVESARAEANLGLLVRGLKHLTAGAASAQEANAVLMQELDALRARLSKVYESESLLKQRVQTLENAIDASQREQQSWLAQEDAFLAELLDEHDQKLFEVERRHERQLAELDLELDELRRKQENAKIEVARLTYERDAAVALLNEPMPITEPLPSAPALPRSLTPTPSPIESPLPPSLLGETGSPRSRTPVVTTKPELSSRPVVGYSLVSDDLEDELDSRPTSRPPRF
jgi:hypothetical protein